MGFDTRHSSRKMQVVVLAIPALLVVFSAPTQICAEIRECTKASCEATGGTFVCSPPVGIPGDGAVHSHSAQSANSEFLCGYAHTFRQGLGDAYEATCTLNPQQPASSENSDARRCESPCNDMSVEKCWVTGGSNPTLTCTYVNAKDARSKTIEICGCWKAAK